MFYSKAQQSSDEIVYRISGTLYGEQVGEEFTSMLEQVVREPVKMLTLDMKDVNSINSANIGRILLYKKKAGEQGRMLRIRGCSDNLYFTFQLIKATQLLDIEK